MPVTDPPIGTWHDDKAEDDDEYRPLSDAEMEAELDQTDADDAADERDQGDGSEEDPDNRKPPAD